MSEIGLNKLKRLGYQFWSSKSPQENLSEESIVFYVLGHKTLITGKLKEFNLVIDFAQELSFKTKKTIKFDSLKLLIKDKGLKESFYKELRGLN